MKILITGNMGYVGPGVVRRLRKAYPSAMLIGYDLGYFAHCLTSPSGFPESLLDCQYFGDVRNFSDALLDGLDAIVHLAAISNDPMGALFEDLTLATNYEASVELARKAKRAGVKSFVFASSCSVYGMADGRAKTEEDEVNPLTAYAKSKIMTEQGLKALADETFTATCLRFATACGMSDRLRLDLVLNDFVAGAVATGRISILSDGTPWRPLIHVQDMARAIDWAIGREQGDGGPCLIVNAGSDQWNYQVKELARAVARVIPGVEVVINEKAQPDKRSYQVSFEKFTKLAQGFLPEIDLTTAVTELRDSLQAVDFRDAEFRKSRFMRLVVLKQLRDNGVINDNLEWVQKRKTADVR
jgi:nucleoside-diphosphate-sugar epimerase